MIQRRRIQASIEKNRITAHVELEQSISMIAVALARKLTGVKIVPVYPVMHRKPVKSNSIKFMSCHVAGSRQTTREYRKGTEVTTLEFQAYIGV